MKIGIISVTRGLSWAAPDEVMLRLAKHAASLGHEVIYSGYPDLEFEARVPTQHRHAISFVRRRAFRPARVHQFLQKRRSSFAVFERSGVDVVLVSAGSIVDAFNHPAISLYAETTELPLVYFCHGHSELYDIPNRLALRGFLENMAALVFVAESNKRTLEGQLETDLKRAHVVRNACSFLLENPLPWPERAGPAKFAIVARLDAYWKGHETLLQVLSSDAWKKRDWTLDCYGKGKDEAYIRQLAVRLGIADRVRVGTHADEIKKVWLDSEVMLLPTRAESFSLAVLEAMMCGRPVVCSNVGDMSMAVKDGETGFLARGESPADFAAAMEKLWQSRSGWRDLGSGAHRLSRSFYEDNPPEKLLEVLNAVVREAAQSDAVPASRRRAVTAAGATGRKRRCARAPRGANALDLAVVSTIKGYPWAGSEELWYAAAAQNLRQQGSVRAVLHQDLAVGSRSALLSRQGAEIFAWRLPIIRRFQSLAGSFVPGRIGRLTGRQDVLLVSCGSLPSLAYVPDLARFLLSPACPPFVILCQFNAESLPFPPLERDMICKVAGRAAHCVFVSSQNLSLARRQLALPLPNSSVIPNPIRFTLDEPLPFPDTGSTVKMACVARFESSWKGQASLLRILARPPWRDRAWELSLYGEGPDREYLEKSVEFHGLAGRVSFRGYVRDVRRVWASNHLMLAPSSGEGMSLAMLEAMMCGRPVVMTAVGGAEECVEDGVTGFTGGTAVGESFAEALERAWIRCADWEAMGRLAHQRAKEISQSDPVGSLVRVLQTAAEKGNRA